MKKENLFVSTTAQDAVEVAAEYGIGIEVAEYCTAFNMDEYFEVTDKAVREKMAGVSSRRFTFHGPFNELSPAAIDPKVLAITKDRYIQAIKLSMSYGIKRIVIHSGYTNHAYYESWFEERSVEFWTSFFDEVPGDYDIAYENVFEATPEQLSKIVKRVNNDRFKLCFDIGHANVIDKDKDMFAWLRVCAPYISHFHIHNNYGKRDEHNALVDGIIDMKAFLILANELCPDATYTIETFNSKTSVAWLFETGLVE